MASPRANKKAMQDLEKWKIKESDVFSKKVTKACKLASVSLQKDINRTVTTPTNFTKNAVGFQFKYDKFGSKNRIYIKDVQANYLGNLIDDNTAVTKFNPFNRAKNAYGNIAGLKTMRNLKAVKQKHNGVSRTVLIKTNVKKKDKRLIAIRKSMTQRKILGSWKSITDKIINNVNRITIKR